MMEDDKLLQKLRTAMHVLRKYAHLPNCTEISHCPFEHADCRKRLGLDTAIAWEASNELAILVDLYTTDFTYDFTCPVSLRDWRIRKVEISLNRLDALHSVLLRHKRSYYHLTVELENTMEILEQIIQILNSSRKTK